MMNSAIQSTSKHQNSTEYYKKNLIEFHNNHSLKVKASEAQLLELFPELASQQP